MSQPGPETPCDCWYVYAVRPVGRPVPPGGILPGTPVESLPRGAIDVLASRVPASLFDKAHPDNLTADPDWMAARISEHHAVVASAGPCLPVAFGALFTSRQRLFDWIGPLLPKLEAALRQAASQTEWAVSLGADDAALTAWLYAHDAKLNQLARAMAEAGEGAAFLIGRRLDKARAAARSACIAQAVQSIERAIAAAGLPFLPEPPRRSLAAWTVLVPHGHAGVPDLSRDLSGGLALRVTGPWPAYAFARSALMQEYAVA